MKDAKPGLMDFPLQIDQPQGGLVRYSLVESTYQLNVLGEQNPDTESDNGGEVNSG